MPTFKLTSGDKTLKLTTGTKKFRIRTIDLFGINEGGVPIGVAGGDLSGTYPDPNVSGMKETGAGTNLVIGAIADGQTLVRSGGDIVGSPGTPPGGFAGGDLSGTYPDPSVVAMTESSGPTSLPIGAIGDDNDVLVRSGTDIVGAHELKDISKIQGGAVASFRGMTFNSVTGEVDILHGSSPTSITGLNMLSLTNRADVAPNSERKILFTADINSLLSYDVTNEASDASYNTNISAITVDRSLSFGGQVALTVGSKDETAVVSHKGTNFGVLNRQTKLVLEHYRDAVGLVIDAKGYFAIEKPSTPGSNPFGELMVETIASSLYLGAAGNRYQRIFEDTTARFGGMLNPNTGVPANWRRWTVEIAPESNTSNGIRVFEPENHGIVQAVLGISANASASPQDYYWPSTTAGSTIASGAGRDAVIGLFPYSADGDELQRDLIITAAGNQGLGTPGTFNDAIKLKNAGGIDIWGDTEFFDTVTSSSFVGPVTGDITGNLTGDVTGNVTGDLTGNVTGDVTGDVTGNLTGNVTGDLTGNVTGDVTGDLTGSVTGDVTGNLTGDVTGNLTGNVTGDITGNVTGDLTGDVTGNLTGDVTGNVAGDVTGDLWGSVYATDGSGPVLTSPATTPGNVAINALGATGIIELNTNSTLALTVDSNQDVHIDGDLYVDGDGTNTPYIIIGNGTSQAAIGLEIGHLRTAPGSSHIDFNTVALTTTGGARIARAADTDGVWQFEQYGLDPIEFYTNSALAMSIDANQDTSLKNSLEVEGGNINFLAGNAAVNTNGHLNISCNSTGGSGFNDGTPGIGTFGDIHLDGALVSVGHAGISYSPAGSGGGDVFGGIFFEGGNAVAGTVASTIKMFTGIYGAGTEMMEGLRINTSGIICATDLSVADASFTGSGNFALRVFANLKPTPICIENAAASLTPVQASAYLAGAPDGTIIFGSADGGTLPVFWKDNAGFKWQWIAIGAVLP